MKNEDLNPETQEKLLQLQKYQEQKLRDPVPQTTTSATKQPCDAENVISKSEPPKISSEPDNSKYFYLFNYNNRILNQH